MIGYRDGKPVINCDVCHKPITDRRGKRIEKTRVAYRQRRQDGIVLDVHNKGACKSKVDSVKISQRAEPEEKE